MGKTVIIFKRDIREMFMTRAFLIICIMAFIITVAASVVTSILLVRREWISEEAARPLLEIIVSLLSYFTPLIILMAFIWGFSGLQIVREKINGITSSLIATSLTPRQLWLGKTLAIFIPGYLISVVSTLIIIISINLAAITPATGRFLFPLPVSLLSLVWNPLLLLGTLLFIILFSLAGNPDIAIAPSFIVGFGLMMGIPIGMATGGIDLASWTFSLWYLGGTITVLVIVVILVRFLTKENIVLSGKGS